MSLVATDSGKTFTPAPAGTHTAVCVRIIDLGTQTSQFYGNAKHKVLIGWELTNELNEEDDNKPFMVFKRYTVSLNEKSNLRLHLQSWRGRAFTEQELSGFHLKNILGVPAMLSVVHELNDGQTWAQVAGVSGLPKGMARPTPINKPEIFDISEWNQELFETFSEKLQKTILDSPEAAARNGKTPTAKADASNPLNSKPYRASDGTMVDHTHPEHPDFIPF